jgi:3-dehydroquinate synthetase
VSFADLRKQVGRGPSPDELMSFMEQDKKVKGGEMTLVLFRGMGDTFVARNVARSTIRAFLQSQL